MPFQLDALGETRRFEGFVEADFDAFERKKWSSRKFTLERRAARQKLVAIARDVRDREPKATESFELGASDDAPSIANGRKVDAVWAYLTRGEAFRKALSSRLSKTNLADTTELFDIAIEHQHASLLFQLDLDSFRLEALFSPRASVDRNNAATKLRYEEDRVALLELCQSLPEAAEVGYLSALKTTEAVDLETIEGWVDGFNGTNESFCARVTWPRAEPLLQSPELLSAAHSAATPLLHLLGHLAWSKDNDFAQVEVEKTIQRTEKKLKKNAIASEDAELAPGTRVTILSGLFAGRAGYLAEPDTKGNVKVMVGPVSVSVPLQDLKVS